MLKDYIALLQQSGQVAFRSAEAIKALGTSKQALLSAISRLRKKGELVSPYRDFYLPIPPEYRTLGCLPADQLLPLLMKHIGIPYYLCLLSAAAQYGAAHQRPQITQVMVSKRMRPIRCGNVVIKYIYKKDLTHVPTKQFAVRTGYLIVSTPEATAMDLFLYPRQAGGLNHIATVLTELIETLNPSQLSSLARVSQEKAWVQRLGFLLEKVESDELAKKNEILNSLYQLVQVTNPAYVSLISGQSRNFPKDKKWHIIINTDIESDL